MEVDLAYGPVADSFTPNDEVSKHFNQAVITYRLPQEARLSFSAGKMLTHLGVEDSTPRITGTIRDLLCGTTECL